MQRPRNTKALLIVLAGALAVRMTSRLLQPRRLDGECIFITGGSRGLGLAIARECARRGASVVICGRDGERLERAAATLREQGAAVLPIACDVRDAAQIQQAIAQASARFGRLDALINNAGTISVGPMDTMTSADYEDALQTHFWAMYHAVEAARTAFTKERRGRIVNITSIGGKISVPHLLPYC
ncbi:MAG TPA: SDR family oxidoreductase, partial [Candidatus Baltobacteraceae bacterium]|nr:SDR family oxidoreductase [Candidatus Baltobacteraceae bacterium]